MIILIMQKVRDKNVRFQGLSLSAKEKYSPVPQVRAQISKLSCRSKSRFFTQRKQLPDGQCVAVAGGADWGVWCQECVRGGGRFALVDQYNCTGRPQKKLGTPLAQSLENRCTHDVAMSL